MAKSVEQTPLRQGLRVGVLWTLLGAGLLAGATLPDRRGLVFAELVGKDFVGGSAPLLVPLPGGFKTLQTGDDDEPMIAVGQDGQLLAVSLLAADQGQPEQVLRARFGTPHEAAGGFDVAGTSGVLHVHRNINTDGDPYAIFAAAAPVRDREHGRRTVLVEMEVPEPVGPGDQEAFAEIAGRIRLRSPASPTQMSPADENDTSEPGPRQDVE